ncbi:MULTISPECIES: helix-turn-helix domain-containing protein [unclassified Coleofasciculus]|uniref:helix-turn-helix domain-containing protein n=1 Tax=unclassified Coleofasciculus TaxID=2692782 RepID=UPI00187F5023|nr:MULTISPECIES: helix-turn-helix transcriptional regulator [unclassified Coleofasciculus]MBE9129897.1 helix-turn-helix transcriptional regulator [Coleofasciculus sp. LEGE 07081]MBE9150617.1 helix-turn-helix transcriptional regulator [Coleofasciculus sp. LEGE 07092]
MVGITRRPLNDKEKRLSRLCQNLRGEHSQVWLAGKVGVHPSTVSFWESGMSSPKQENLEKLARFMGCDLEVLEKHLEFGTDLPKLSALELPIEQLLEVVRSRSTSERVLVAQAALEGIEV